jgi:uridylate kinase
MRILLKLSGEAFSGKGELGIDENALSYTLNEIETIRNLSVETALVVGGGNFLRGRSIDFLDRAVADQVGMMATVMNGLVLKDALSQRGITSVIQSAVPNNWTDPVNPANAKAALSNGDVVIFAGGTGNPFVTTDTASAIRSIEIGADAILKATQVDGVYSADPKLDSSAQRYEQIGFDEVIENNLEVMDIAAFDLCSQYKMPIVVFDFYSAGNLQRVVEGDHVGTLVE